MIWSIRSRGEFEHLAAHGRRIRTSSLWCTAVVDPRAERPRVAFAIGRAIGPAVVRNRLRRRLREMLRVMPLAAGWYLVGARPSSVQLRSDQLRREVASLVDQLARLAPVDPGIRVSAVGPEGARP